MYSNTPTRRGDEWMRRVERRLEDQDTRLRSSSVASYRARNDVNGTDAGGAASFLFGTTYDTPPVVTATGGNGEQVSIVTVTGTGFTALFTYAGGAPVISGPVRCLWHALPQTP